MVKHMRTILEANNYADTYINLERFEEAKTLLRKWMPFVARRVLGAGDLYHAPDEGITPPAI